MIATSLLPKFATNRTTIPTNALSFLLSGLKKPPGSRLPVTQPRATSQPPPVTKSVQFDLDSPSTSSSSISSSGLDSPDQIRQRRHRSSGGTNSLNQNSSFTTNESPNSRRQRHRRHASHTDLARAPSPTPSDMTVDLPERFDQHGRRKPERGEDPWADKFEDFLNGKGVAGMFLEKLTGGLGGGRDRDRDGGRKRRRK